MTEFGLLLEHQTTAALCVAPALLVGVMSMTFDSIHVVQVPVDEPAVVCVTVRVAVDGAQAAALPNAVAVVALDAAGVLPSATQLALPQAAGVPMPATLGPTITFNQSAAAVRQWVLPLQPATTFTVSGADLGTTRRVFVTVWGGVVVSSAVGVAGPVADGMAVAVSATVTRCTDGAALGPDCVPPTPPVAVTPARTTWRLPVGGGTHWLHTVVPAAHAPLTLTATFASNDSTPCTGVDDVAVVTFAPGRGVPGNDMHRLPPGAIRLRLPSPDSSAVLECPFPGTWVASVDTPPASSRCAVVVTAGTPPGASPATRVPLTAATSPDWVFQEWYSEATMLLLSPNTSTTAVGYQMQLPDGAATAFLTIVLTAEVSGQGQVSSASWELPPVGAGVSSLVVAATLTDPATAGVDVTMSASFRGTACGAPPPAATLRLNGTAATTAATATAAAAAAAVAAGMTPVIVRVRATLGLCSSQCRGQCDLVWQSGVAVGVCRCHNPLMYAGPDCATPIHTEAQWRTQVALLSVSNVFMLPAVAVSLTNGLVPEATVFAGTAVASGLYHSCDEFGTCFGSSYESLQALDLACSFMSVITVLVVLSGLNLPSRSTLYPAMFAALVYIALNNPPSSQTAVTFVVVVAVLVILMGVLSAAVCRLATTAVSAPPPWLLAGARALTHPPCTPGDTVSSLRAKPASWRRWWLRVLHMMWELLFCAGNLSWPSLVAGIVVAVAAVVCKTQATNSTYFWLHSLWHVFIMTACCLLLLGRRKPWEPYCGCRQAPTDPLGTALQPSSPALRRPLLPTVLP